MTERGYDAVIIPAHVRREQEMERRLKVLEAEVERLWDEIYHLRNHRTEDDE